jgi:ribosome biogenesis protein NSA1
MGNVSHFDVAARRVVGGFKGYAGAVTDLACNEQCAEVIATCSIDRHVRVHRISDRKLLHKVCPAATFPGVIGSFI